MKVDYVTHSGDDLLVVNAARVSLDKHHKQFEESDSKLINFLARNHHWTPFGHPHITLRVTVPIFVANQLKRHNVGFVINEVSRRYVDSEPEFYHPDKFGKRAPNKKQGALEDEFVDVNVSHHYKRCLEIYNQLLDNQVAPEDARMVLPLAMYTSWYWTGSLFAYSRMYNLRIKKDTQRETREVADMIGGCISPLFPVSWLALTQ
jgi:thymidylate synthase (FAD)